LSEDIKNKSYSKSENSTIRDSEIDGGSVIPRDTYHIKYRDSMLNRRGIFISFRVNVQELELLESLAKKRGMSISGVIREALGVYNSLLMNVTQVKSETVVINNPVININSPQPQQERDQSSDKRVKILERRVRELEDSIKEYEEEIDRLEAENAKARDKVKAYEERLMMLKTRVQFALDYLNKGNIERAKQILSQLDFKVLG